VDETASKITTSAEAADHEPSHTLSEHDGGDRLLEAPAVLAVLANSNLRYGKQKIAMLHHVCELAFFFLPGCMKLYMF
jgi:hypothetical protein